MALTFQERMYQIETDLITSTIYQLQKGNIGTADFQQKKLRQLGVLEKKNLEIIEKGFINARPLLITELETAQKNVSKEIDSMAKSLSQATRVNVDPNLKSILETFEAKAVGDISKTSSTMITFLNEQYINAVDDIVASRLISGEALQTSVEKLTRQLINSGVTSLVDIRGHNWSLEGYSNMVLRSNTRQVSTQTQLTKFDEYDVDLVEISSHIGARPNCEPYQGKIYSRSGNHKVFPPLSSTSMGEIDGLFGINCGHRMYPYIPGTKKTYKQYGKRENKQAYEESQKQRGLERKVRQSKHDIKNSKRSIQVAEATDNKSLLRNSEQNLKIQNQLLKERQENLRNYTEEVGRTYRPERTTVY
jgi:hypothetical protein